MKKFSDWKLSRKLPLTIALPAILLIIVAGVLQLLYTAQALDQDRKAVFQSYVHEKRDTIERWLQEGAIDVLSLADNFGVRVAIEEFSAAWDTLGAKGSDDLRRLYISDNPHPIGKKDELVMASDGSDWSTIHNRHHVSLRAYQRARGYYDLFLFDLSGDLIYSVFKEDDFALNFVSGKYAESGLGEVFQRAIALEAGSFYMTEIAAYAPSADAPALFMSSPVFKDGKRIGVVAVQLPLDVMQRILTDAELLGETGEVYLVDNNGMALNGSRHEAGHKALETLPGLEHILHALTGEEAHFSSTLGLDGHQVVAETSSVSTPKGDHWGLIFEMDRVEAMALILKETNARILEVLLVGLLLGCLGWFTVRGVTRRIEQIVAEMEQIAEGHYDQDIAGQERSDEVGFIAKTLAKLQVRLAEGAQLQEREKEVQEANKLVVEQLSTALVNLAKGDFRDEVTSRFPEEHKRLRYNINDAMAGLTDVVSTVRGTAESINLGAEEISASADELSQRTESQAATLEQTAAALDEVTASVRSATEHADNVERTVLEARNKAEESGVIVNETIQAMTEIEESSRQIESITAVIDDIAFQTSLLALNAGVEAERAGEAGRGFSVVASEVRGLAQRSAEAAKEIKTLIEASSQQVDNGVQKVGQTGESLTVILSQVKEISELVREIAQSSRQQSTALTEINTGMTQLDRVTQGNAAMVEENTSAAHILRSEASKLLQHVGKFKTKQDTSDKRVSPAQGTAQRTEQQDRTEVDLDMDAPPFSGAEKKVASGTWSDF